MYAHVQNGKVIEYPYTLAMLKALYPDMVWPDPMSTDLLAHFDVYPVTPVTPPAYDGYTQMLQELEPSWSAGEWVQQWNVVELPGAEARAQLDALKQRKNQEINDARLKANTTSFDYQGKTIACDTLSRSDIDATNGYVSLFGTFYPNWPGGWKATDNSYVPIATVDEWKAFYSAMVARGQTNFARAQTLKAKLASATTAAQVMAINW